MINCESWNYFLSLLRSNELNELMKYTEFHRKITKSGWRFDYAEGSHYFYTKEIKDKDGKVIEVKQSPPVPFHGAKEIAEPLRKAIARDMGII